MSTPVLSPAEAIELAAEFSVVFGLDAAERDIRRILPLAELDKLSESGLLAITVPAKYGGADVSVATLVEVIRLLSVGDPNIGQIPHSHFVYVNQMRLQGTDAQQRWIFGEVRNGRRIGNAQSEAGTRHVRDIRTTLTAVKPGSWRLNGRKFYATGALLAHRIPVLAHLGPDGPLHVAWIPTDTRSASRSIDDWNALGQRTTASGSVLLDRRVEVPDDVITPYAVTLRGTARPTARSHRCCTPRSTRASPGRRSPTPPRSYGSTAAPTLIAKVDRAAEDPTIIRAFGEIELAVRAAEALLAEAARTRRPRQRSASPPSPPRPRPSPSPQPAHPPPMRPSRRAADCSKWPAPGRPPPGRAWTATGATPAPTPCTTPPGGRSSTWAALPSTAPHPLTTDRCDHVADQSGSRPPPPA